MKIAEQQRSIEYLKKLIQPNMRVYTILRTASRSGESCVVDLYVMQPNGRPNGAWEPIRVGWSAAKALGWLWCGRHEGVRVKKNGVWAESHLVYQLGGVLFPDGFDEDLSMYERGATRFNQVGGFALTQVPL